MLLVSPENPESRICPVDRLDCVVFNLKIQSDCDLSKVHAASEEKVIVEAEGTFLSEK